MLQVNVQRFWIYYNLSYNKTVYYDISKKNQEIVLEFW